MKRKIGGIVLALVLGVLGTIALMTYVDRAKDDAIRDEEQVQILVVESPIRQGAPIGEISDRVVLTDVPTRLASPDALATLADVDPTLVAGIDLVVGEQLTTTRLVDPTTLIRVEVPEGLQEITVALDPQRAVGGALSPGDSVGLLLSFEPFDIGQPIPGIGEPTDPAVTDTTVTATKTPNTTKLTLNSILVTAVQLSQSDSERVAAEQAPTTDGSTSAGPVNEAPGDRLLITLAVTTAEAEQITFTSEFGTIWLTRQNSETDATGSRILTRDQVYVSVPR